MNSIKFFTNIFISFQTVIQNKTQQWLNKRVKTTPKITLDQHKIFIFPTKEGFLFIFMLIAMFFGSVNYSNSLIMGFTFLLSGVFIISILHTFRNLSGLTIEASRTQACFAGEKAAFSINMSRSGTRTYQAIILCWGHNVTERCDLIEDQEATITLLLPTYKRGWYRPGRFQIFTTFPLGLIQAWTWLDLDMQCLIYPKPITNNFLQKGVTGQSGINFSREEGADDFSGLKPYLPGDSLKHVHWKILARNDELYSKTFVSSTQAIYTLTWQNFAPLNAETRLSYLCHWILKLSEQDCMFGLQLPNDKITPNRGSRHKHQCLSALAQY